MTTQAWLYLVAGAVAVAGGSLLGALDLLPERPSAWQRLRKGVGLTVLAVGLYVVIGTLAQHGVLLPSGGAQP